ncbi:hypothetical protein ACIGNX_22520 [Actinosynnema sp. NPDC053489]|uniref:hypothetical protein n=1 Tax=Actinosynnema sp. NPDC053489 TaxID=3363916 RepID=UPI0037C96DBF
MIPTTLVLLGAAPVGAVQQDVTCAGTATTTTNLIYSPCVSSDPTLTAATSGSTFTGPGSCLTLPGFSSGTSVLTWNNGNTSTFAFNATTAIVGGNVVITRTGTITAGRFAGDTAIRVVTYPAPNPLGCLTTGVTSRTGVVTLTITSP